MIDAELSGRELVEERVQEERSCTSMASPKSTDCLINLRMRTISSCSDCWGKGIGSRRRMPRLITGTARPASPLLNEALDNSRGKPVEQELG